MRCAAYTRTTSWKKGLDLKDYTVERQAAAVAAYITGRGWELTKNYSDKSGNSGFFAMQDAGLAREFDTVVFPSIYFVTDDFPLVTQRLQEALYPAGVQIAVVDEDFYSGEKSVDEVADYFEAKRRERHSDIAKNWKESKGDGFVLTNSVPFGFIRRNGETQMVIDEELRPIVTEMFRMKAKGIRVGLIADWLNRNGVDTPSMRRKKMYGRETDRAAEMWNSEMVSKLLVSPVYTGARVEASK
ncbi:MAG: recombinase family protein [Clostridiales bacterium]|nr:recombinase family protein [Clostridiales bacterium]